MQNIFRSDPILIPMSTTFDLEVEGNRLTGAMLYLDIEKPILDGKVEDDRVSFKIFDDTTRTTFSYKGKIVGDTIRFRVAANRGRYSIIEFTAKKVGPASGSTAEPPRDLPKGD